MFQNYVRSNFFSHTSLLTQPFLSSPLLHWTIPMVFVQVCGGLAFFPSCHHNHLAATAVTGGGFPSSHGFSHENCCCRFCSCCCGSCCFRALFMFCRPVATLNGVVTTWAKAPTHVNMLRDSPIFPLRKEFFFPQKPTLCVDNLVQQTDKKVWQKRRRIKRVWKTSRGFFGQFLEIIIMREQLRFRASTYLYFLLVPLLSAKVTKSILMIF